MYYNWAQHLTLNIKPQVIYLDPMFPLREKSAAVKKDMQLFHKLHGMSAQEINTLFEWALNQTQHKVVIKRPIKAKIVNMIEPTYQVTGKTCRFDVYQAN